MQTHLILLAVLGTSSSATPIFEPKTASDEIEVTDASRSCWGSKRSDTSWAPDSKGGFVQGTRRISLEQYEDLRALLLEARESPSDLLASIGITAKTLEEHREEILDHAVSEPWRSRLEPIAKDVEGALSFQRVAKSIQKELLGLNWDSTLNNHFRVLLPGTPVIQVESSSEVAWMLPWTVTANGQSWTVADVRISQALLPLSATDGPCRNLLDGTEYWSNLFWKDELFWGRTVGEEIMHSLCKPRYIPAAGFETFDKQYRVERATITENELDESTMQFRISSRAPAIVDEVQWANRLRDDELSNDWSDLLRTIQTASEAIERVPWIGDWKLGSTEHRISMNVVGTTPHGSERLEERAALLWSHAELPGTPWLQISLYRGRSKRGTIWLGHATYASVIEFAFSEPGVHWFDELEIRFRPSSSSQTYGLVDAVGRLELRTTE